MTYHLSWLEQLPPELMKQEIAPHLNQYDIASSLVTSKRMHRLFTEPHQACRLLQLIIEGNDAEATRFATLNPSLIFQHVTLKSEHTPKIISPLKFAFKIYHTVLWQSFFKLIEPNPSLVMLFLQQFDEQEDYIDMNNLMTSYEGYFKKYIDWIENNMRQPNELDQAFLRIGLEQRRLPLNLLKDFFSLEKSWLDINDVCDNEAPSTESIEVYNEFTEQNEPLLPFVKDIGLGSHFILFRGTGPKVIRCNGDYGRIAQLTLELDQDVTAFYNIYTSRKNDLSIYLEQLKKGSKEAIIYQINTTP